MPTDVSFGFSVLIAGRPVPEYVKDGRVYVESNLWTPFSYNQVTEEFVNGEQEVQKCPVTPYQLFVQLAPHAQDSAVFVYVDGVQVTKMMMEKGQSKIIRGFEDKGGIKEFLFALPRFATCKSDRLASKRQSRIGTIEIVRFEASYIREEYRPTKDVTFNQANKSDTRQVTEGKYTMSTTKKGRYVHRTRPYDVQLKKLWRIGSECGRLSVNYRMGHNLQDMGVELKPMDWSKVVRVSRRSSSSPSSPNHSPSPKTTPESSRCCSPEPCNVPPSLMEDIKPNIVTLKIIS